MRSPIKWICGFLAVGLLSVSGWVSAQTIAAPSYSATGSYTVSWSAGVGCVNPGEPEYYCYWIRESKNNSPIDEHWDVSSKNFTGKTTGYYKYEYMGAWLVNGELVGEGPYATVTVLVALPNTDVDGDGVLDNIDAFPINAAEWADTDGDGVGNNGDTDDDGDGIPDTWENSHGLNSLTYDSHLDYDHDGSTNLQEFQAGTSPSNLLSCSTSCLFSSPPSPGRIEFPAPDLTSDAIGATAGSFNVGNSGAAEYTIPLYVPPGTAGMAPKLALRYSSSGGNGSMGEGWSVGALSAISRCPQNRAQDGQVIPVNMTGTDRFCLDGERLVLVNTSNPYGGNNVEYRTESDSFKKVVSISPAASTDPSFFQVWNRDGSLSTYGSSNDAKLIDGPTGKVRVWAQNKIEDSFSAQNGPANNVVSYIYNTGPNVFDFRIQRIEYAFANTTNDPNATINFIYQARPDSGLQYKERLSQIQIRNKQNVYLRRYEFSYLDVTARKNKTSKLSSITECRDSVCLPATQFVWSDTGVDFSFTSAGSVPGFSTYPYATENLHRFAATDFNGDGKGDVVWLEPDGGNYRFKASPSNGTTLAAAATQSLNSHDIDSWTMADYNQDGYPDILFTVNGSLYVYLNTLVSGQRSYAVAPVQLIANMDMGTEPGLDGSWFNPKGIFADINADGLMDVIYNKAIYYMVADPQQTNGPYKFGPASVITLGTLYAGGINQSARIGISGQENWIGFKTLNLDTADFSGDFNGDGLPDMVVDAQCTDSLSRSFLCAKVILANKGAAGWGYFDKTGVHASYEDASILANGKPLSIGDLNGDGMSDLVWYQGGEGQGWYAHRGDKTQLGNMYSIFADNTNGPQIVESGLRDINMDGLPEFVYRWPVTGDDQIKVVPNNFFAGGGFQGTLAYILATVVGSYGWNHTFIDRFGDGSIDINGDGILDFVDLSSNVYHGSKASATAWNKVTRITDGLGDEININYGQLSNPAVYAREFNASALNQGFPVIDVFAPLTVVSSVSRSSPIASNAAYQRSTSYQYQGLKMQPAGRGFLGFRVTKITDNETGNVVSNSFRQDFPFIGLLADTQSYVSGQSTPLSEAVNTYTKLSHINGLTSPPYLVVSTQSVTTQRVAESSASANTPTLTINGVLTTTTATQSNFDGYGNAGTVTVVVAGDGTTHTTTTSNTYSNSTSNWLIGRLTQSTVVRQLGSSTITRATSFTYDSYGRLLTEVREPQGSDVVKLTTSYEYDAFGNPNKITETSAASTRYSRMVYDATGRFVDKTYNGLEQLVSEVSQRDVYGNPETVKGLNGVEQYFRYGTFGRQFFSATKAGNTATIQHRLCGGSISCPTGAMLRVQTTGNDGSLAYTYADKLGREVRAEVKAFNGGLSITDTQYDALGRVKKGSVPYFGGGTVYWATSDYDHLSRVIKVVDAQGGISTNVFTRYTNGATVGVQQLSTNQLSQTKTTITNGLGQSIRVVDQLTGYINYTYDAAGNLIQLNSNGVTSTIGYDVLGRRISLDDPDQGDWDYIYNAFGEMSDQQDSGGGLTHIDFDALGRTSQRRDYTSGMVLASDTRWTYGATAAARNVGQVIQEQDLVSGYIKVFAYDTFGRASQIVTSLGQNGADGDYAEYQTYDQYGRKFQTVDATAKGVQHVYNANGFLEKLVEATNTSKIYHTVTQTNARGQVTGETMMGTAFQMARSYSPQTGLATSIMATSAQYTLTPSGSTLLDLTLTFDAVGNLNTRTRQVKATSSLSARTLSETFTYDQLNRLTQITATGQSTQSLTYDASGNILTKSGVGSYSYGAGSAGPHAVTSVGGVTYTYDAIGNMLTGDGRTAVYNAFRKPVSVTKGSDSTAFNYAPDRSHYKRVDNNGVNVTTTISVGNVEFIRVGINPVTTKRYIGGVAMVTDSTATGHEEHVLLTDHLGSTVAIAKATALDLQQLDYDAFGKRRNLWTLNELALAEFDLLNDLTTTGFTGHEMLDELGLIHMQGRVYDPKLGRFLSADPYISELDNTQNMNRYSYVYNNPLTLTDPNGFEAYAYGFSDEDFANAYAYEMANYQTALLGMAVFGNSGAGFQMDPFVMMDQNMYAMMRVAQNPSLSLSLGSSSRIATIPESGPSSGGQEVRPMPPGADVVVVPGKRPDSTGGLPSPQITLVDSSQTATPSSSVAITQAATTDDNAVNSNNVVKSSVSLITDQSYSTPEAAAKGFYDDNEGLYQSTGTGKEISGLIVQIGKSYYVTTASIDGTKQTTDYSVRGGLPDGGVYVGHMHTHAVAGGLEFSGIFGDVQGAKILPMYLRNELGDILMLPKGSISPIQSELVCSGCLPALGIP